MTRQTRMVLVTLALAVIGLVALSMLADRYRRLMTDQPDPAGSATLAEELPIEHDADLDRRFRAFLVVRTEVRRAADTLPDDGSSVSASDRLRLMEEVRKGKESWLAEAGLTGDAYEELRGALLIWEHGGRLDPGLQSLFDAHRERLEDLDLGWLEGLDAPSEDSVEP